MPLTARRIVKENGELLEEVNQLRAAVNICRELTKRTRQSRSVNKAAIETIGSPPHFFGAHQTIKP